MHWQWNPFKEMCTWRGEIIWRILSSFITLPKKRGAINCESHGTISFMSHVVKIYMTIILKRIKSNMNPEIGGGQWTYLECRGTNNAIYIFHSLLFMPWAHLFCRIVAVNLGCLSHWNEYIYGSWWLFMMMIMMIDWDNVTPIFMLSLRLHIKT